MTFSVFLSSNIKEDDYESWRAFICYKSHAVLRGRIGLDFEKHSRNVAFKQIWFPADSSNGEQTWHDELKQERQRVVSLALANESFVPYEETGGQFKAFATQLSTAISAAATAINRDIETITKKAHRPTVLKTQLQKRALVLLARDFGVELPQGVSSEDVAERSILHSLTHWLDLCSPCSISPSTRTSSYLPDRLSP